MRRLGLLPSRAGYGPRRITREPTVSRYYLLTSSSRPTCRGTEARQRELRRRRRKTRFPSHAVRRSVGRSVRRSPDGGGGSSSSGNVPYPRRGMEPKVPASFPKGGARSRRSSIESFDDKNSLVVSVCVLQRAERSAYILHPPPERCGREPAV